MGFIKGLFTTIGALATLLGAMVILLYAAGFVQIHPGPTAIQLFTTDSKIEVKDDSKQEVKAYAPTPPSTAPHSPPAVLQTQPTPAPTPAPPTSDARHADNSSSTHKQSGSSGSDVAEAALVQTKGRTRQPRVRHVYNYPEEDSEVTPAYTYEQPASDSCSCTCPGDTVTADASASSASASSSEDGNQNTESYQQYRVGNTIITRRVVRRVYHYRSQN